MKKNKSVSKMEHNIFSNDKMQSIFHVDTETLSEMMSYCLYSKNNIYTFNNRNEISSIGYFVKYGRLYYIEYTTFLVKFCIFEAVNVMVSNPLDINQLEYVSAYRLLQCDILQGHRFDKWEENLAHSKCKLSAETISDVNSMYFMTQNYLKQITKSEEK